MSPQSLKKFEKLAWISRLYFAVNPLAVRIPRDDFVAPEGGEKKDLVFHFPFHLVLVDAEPPRMRMIEDRNDENPDDRMILEEETAGGLAALMQRMASGSKQDLLRQASLGRDFVMRERGWSRQASLIAQYLQS